MHQLQARLPLLLEEPEQEGPGQNMPLQQPVLLGS
jgi:hypothetical protein